MDNVLSFAAIGYFFGGEEGAKLGALIAFIIPIVFLAGMGLLYGILCLYMKFKKNKD